MRLDEYPITLKHLVIVVGILGAAYIVANLWADHLAIRAIVGQLNDITTTVNAAIVGVK